MAEREGYYAEQGLVTELRPAFSAEGSITDAVDAVITGKADFGIASNDSLMKLQAAGAPVVAIAAIYQRSPNALMSLAESNITRPEDLKGKTITVSGTSRIYYLNSLLHNAGIDLADLNIVDRTDFSTDELTSGKVDALDTFITNEPAVLEEEGYAYNLIIYADYGVDGYVNVIFASQDTINKRPELVEAFLRATLKGYQAAVDDPEKAAALSVEYNSNLSYETELTNMLVSVPLLHPNGSQIGMMTSEIWDLGSQLMREAGELSDEFDVTRSYTLDFLNKIYNP